MSAGRARLALRAALGAGAAGALACAHAPKATPPTGGETGEAPAAAAVVGEGTASYYGKGFAGRPTASGERFDPAAMTAAHRSLPFGTCLRVRNLDNGREARVRVNDRGPYASGRIVDVSTAAARVLGMIERGLARVRLFRCRG